MSSLMAPWQNGPYTNNPNCVSPSGTSSWIKLMKGKALRKHSLYENIAASVLLKMFISGNERCHTTDAPSSQFPSGTRFSNVNNIQPMIPDDRKNITTQWCSTGRHFTAATKSFARAKGLSLPLMISYNKTEAAVFPCRLCFLRAFSFLSMITGIERILRFCNKISLTVVNLKPYYFMSRSIMWTTGRHVCNYWRQFTNRGISR